MTQKKEKVLVGDLSPSQLLLSFGVGAVIDLPWLSVMVMGLEDWPLDQAREITEERLLAAVRQQLGGQVASLRAPPLAPETSWFLGGPFREEATVGVPVAPFPRWVLCPYCRLLAPLASGLFELKLDRYRPERSRYIHSNCKKPGKPPEVVPARFLVACENGHLNDFPWVRFCHGGPTDCRSRLILIESGPSGDVAGITVKCEVCKATKNMSLAFDADQKGTLPPCQGRWPHLRSFAGEGCDVKQVTAILLGASNSWFPMTLSALSVPRSADKLGQLVDAHWAILEKAASLQNIELLRQVGQLRAFSSYGDEDLWQAVERRRRGPPEGNGDASDLKEPEWELFSRPDLQRNSRDFRLREVAPPRAYKDLFERVVLAEKLREVRTLIGFTRIESPGDYGPGELPGERRAPLSRRPPAWVPASDVRGEGIFIQFSEGALRSWMERVPSYDAEFFEAHRGWRRSRGLDPGAAYPGLRYVLLHSFAHALMRQLSLECGYTTASIRERIYCRSPEEEGDPMAGVLLYTAAPDSEGTLGGLVSLGEPETLGRHLDQALEGMRLCASDPLCAEHRPAKEGTALHGAACHACLFAPETSCERGNRYLDRSVLVGTVDDRKGLAFFGEGHDR